MHKIKVLLADDHAVVAQGLAAYLKESFEQVEVVHDGRALLDAVETFCPDVVVTDLSMPLLNGMEAVRQIRAKHPEMKIVVLTMHKDTQLAAEAFRAGASGYLLKVSPGEELVTAIQQVSLGRAYVTTLLAKDLITLLMEGGGEITGEFAGQLPGGVRGGESPLTSRQREVLQLVAEGRTMKEVAAILHISPRTAESHKYEIMKVLGVNSTAALIQYAIKAKLIGE
jgi:DNA-binding NarL/FixJ family response regulator